MNQARTVDYDVDNRHWRTYLRRALSGSCPRCGEPTLFASRNRLAKTCANCGLEFRRESGAMTGQMYLSAAISQVFAALLVVLIWLGTDWEPWTSISVAAPIVVLFCYWLLPKSMGAWVAIEFMTDVGNGEPWARE